MAVGRTIVTVAFHLAGASPSTHVVKLHRLKQLQALKHCETSAKDHAQKLIRVLDTT